MRLDIKQDLQESISISMEKGPVQDVTLEKNKHVVEYLQDGINGWDWWGIVRITTIEQCYRKIMARQAEFNNTAEHTTKTIYPTWWQIEL
jgi:hypothetical protein